ncbi:MAG: DUF2905 domain-containing protein [Bryobacterales bacterium]|nr:DUF2905 domain-containing protein [Bryobacterales bacterium]
MEGVGRLLVILGVILAVTGLLFMYGERLPFRIGRLPGDIVIRGKNSVFYFPLTTLILINVVLMFVMWMMRRH